MSIYVNLMVAYDKILRVQDTGSGEDRGHAVVQIASESGDINIFATPEQAIQIGEVFTQRGQELIAAREAKEQKKTFCEAVRGAA